MKVLKCATCGKVVEVLVDSKVPVMCCGKPMQELTANTSDGATEKHVPVVSVEGDVLVVRVGEVDHPMLDVHWITSIMVVLGNQVLRANLNPGEEPAAKFALGGYKGHVEVFEYCNLHGLWKTELDV